MKSLLWLACFVAVMASLWLASPWLGGLALFGFAGAAWLLRGKYGRERDSPELLEFDIEHDADGRPQTGVMLWLSWAAEAVFDTPSYWLHRVGM